MSAGPCIVRLRACRQGFKSFGNVIALDESNFLNEAGLFINEDENGWFQEGSPKLTEL